MRKRRPKLTESEYHIRWIIRRDWPGIEECEMNEPDAWVEDDLTKHLRQRNMIGMLAEWDDNVTIGYMVYSLHKDHIELERLVVHPEMRRRGVGEALMSKLRSKLYGRRQYIEVPVRESNLGAQLWLREIGFRAYHVESDAGKYLDEPTYWFVYELEGKR